MPKPFAALSQNVVSTLIDLFELDLTAILPVGSTDQAIYRFCNWQQVGGQDVVYQGLTYTAIPLESEGFESGGSQQLARPVLTLANVGLVITGLIVTYGDLVGATVTRIRTLATYLDDGSTPDPDAYFGPDVFVVEQRIREDKLTTSWQLAIPFDLEGATLPSRKLLREQCQWTYRDSIGCGFIRKAVGSGTYTLPSVTGTYTSDGNVLTAIASNAYSKDDVITLTIGSGSAPSGSYTVTREGAAGFDATYSTTYGRSGTWTIQLYSPLQYRYRLYVDNHGFSAGQTVTVRLTYTMPASWSTTYQNRERVQYAGTTTVLAANTNDLWLSNSGIVFNHGASFPSPVSTITTTYSGSFSGSPSTVLVNATSHGLTRGTPIGVRFNGGSSADGEYLVLEADPNTFRIKNPPGIASTGSLEWTLYWDINDNPVFNVNQDVCGKRLTSCKLRFGNTPALPFGGFPGLVDRMG